MRVIFAIVLTVALSATGFSQDLDLSVLLEKEKGGGEKHTTGFLFSIYSQHISNQILNDCIYDYSCSTFSKGSFSEFGIVKGLLLTADRLTRCNRASHAEMPAIRFNREGKITDHWDDYKKPD